MVSTVLDNELYRLAGWIVACANEDGSMPSSRPGDNSCGEWTTGSMLGAALMAEGRIPRLPGLSRAAEAGHGWMSARYKRVRVPAMPEGEVAVDPTAAYLEFLVLGRSLGVLPGDTELDQDISTLAEALIQACTEAGAWPFFFEDEAQSIVSTALTLRALSRLSDGASDIRGLPEVLDRASRWLANSLMHSTASQIGYVLASVGGLLPGSIREAGLNRLLGEMVVGSETLWESTVERHKYFTVLRFGAPYCAAALLDWPATPEPTKLRILAWMTRQTEGGFVELSGSQGLTTWPTRDFVVAISSIQHTEYVGSLPTVLAQLENSASMLSRAQDALRVYEQTVPASSRRWASRFKKQLHLLHISDLHLGSYQEQRVHPLDHMDLVRDLADLSIEAIDFVVVSGDLTSNTSTRRELHPVEFEEARGFLSRLLGELNLTGSNLVIVPGNHDIMWSSETGLGQRSRTLNSINYHNFYRSLYNAEPAEHFFVGAVDHEAKVAIVGLNSCLSEKDRESAWIGEIGQEQLRQLRTWLDGLGGDSAEGYIKIATLHHHLVPVAYLEEIRDPGQPVSLTIDAEGVVRTLLRYGFDLVLHGHQHQPFTAIESRLYLEERGPLAGDDGLRSSLIIHGTGSLGAPRNALGAIAQNAYTVVTLTSEGVNLHVRQAHPEQPGAFTSYMNRLIPRI